MSVTIFGPCATADGATMWVDAIAHEAPGGRLLVEQRTRCGTLRADEFDDAQPERVAVTIDHRATELGELVYLERDGALTAVAVLDLEPEDFAAFGPAKWSTVTGHDRESGSVQLRSIGIVKPADAAAVGLGTIRMVPGDVRRGALRHLGLGDIPPLLARAEAWHHTHRSGGLDIVDRWPGCDAPAPRKPFSLGDIVEPERRDNRSKPRYEMRIHGETVQINRHYAGARVLSVR